MKRLPLAVLSTAVLAAAVAVGAALRPVDSGAARPQSETATADTDQSDQKAFGGPFTLTDQNGVRRTDKDFRGKYMLVFFGYTYCPDVCPTALATEAEALDKLGPQAGRIVPIFISVDPKRDTPTQLKTYLSSFDGNPSSTRPNFVGLTGSDEEIAQAAKAYSVLYNKHLNGQVEDGSNYSIDHTADTYLMGPDGKFVAYYSQGILPDEMAADLKSRLTPG